jgi:hypothetical protein
MKRLVSTLAALALVPSLALAGEKTVVVKTTEDARFPHDEKVCQSTGFPVNVRLGASVWSLQTRASTGAVVNEAIRQVGTATGCGLLGAGFTGPFAIRFSLEDGVYYASGSCDILSMNLPEPGVLLVGCALKMLEGPTGFVSGIATSASVFTVKDVPGFATGSVWTLHIYTKD